MKSSTQFMLFVYICMTIMLMFHACSLQAGPVWDDEIFSNQNQKGYEPTEEVEEVEKTRLHAVPVTPVYEPRRRVVPVYPVPFVTPQVFAPYSPIPYFSPFPQQPRREITCQTFGNITHCY